MNGKESDVRLPGIVVALSNTANARLLKRLVGDTYRLHPVRPTEDWDAQLRDAGDADLVVIDNAVLKRWRDRILDWRSRAVPLVLPVLLVADSRVESHSRTTAELGHGVDDVLRIPTSRAELLARIDNLLRLRRMSRQQEESRHQLKAMVSALHTLNACDAIVVRSKTEQQLIDSLCRTIVEEEGYSLAWIGFAPEDGSDPVKIRASAGPARAFVRELAGAWAADPSARGDVARAMATGEVQISVNLAEDSRVPKARDGVLAHGLAAAIALPLKAESGTPGCLAIYSDTPGHFGREERQLLERLADNLVFGLNALRVQRERERQAAEIHDLAYTDALTGLPNRRHLVKYLDSMLAGDKRDPPSGAMLFIDLDGFKLINDALGHETGDQVLRQIAQRLKGSVRDSDLVVRQGGDEFLVVLFNDPRHPKSDREDDFVDSVHMLAARIIEHLGKPLTAGGHEHRLSASIGISLYPEHARDAGRLIELADTAMYEAKNAGGDRAHLFTADMTTSRQERFSMQSRLREALAQEEFALHYQPIFELEHCTVMAAEALIRWPQPDGEILMPGAFMPLIEEMGLIRPLGDWVLETAARQLRHWQDRGLDLAMAVNVSVNQLYPDGDAGQFAAIVSPHVAPSCLHLEITEDALMTDPEALHQLLTKLEKAGFRLAIDDFGTGFSSLSRLQHLPIHSLKIDRSFVNELGVAGRKGETLVAIIHQMARRLNLQTIAEGIETDEQRRMLLEIGPGWGQGFWFSRAVPAGDFESRLNARVGG